MFMRAEESGRSRAWPFLPQFGGQFAKLPDSSRATAEWYPKDNVFFCPPLSLSFREAERRGEGESGWLEERSGTQPHELSIVIFS